MCELLSQLRPGAFCAYAFIVHVDWDHSETHSVYIYCVSTVRDRVSFDPFHRVLSYQGLSGDTVLLLCSAGQGPAVFCAWYKG